MRKHVSLALFVALALSSVAYAADPQQVFKKDELRSWDRENLAGGVGKVPGKFAFNRNEAKPDQAIKEIGWLTIPVDGSIGLHKHENNEDVYIIVSGEGLFTDTDGKETVVKDGDVTIARKGQSHGLRNTGKGPLVVLDIIGQQ